MYKERQTAIEREERESLLSTPIFVCTLGFPKMPTILHIFEPRYRLMIRRCLESGHPRFGMVLHSQELNSATPGMSTYGTMLEIKTVQMLPDGRSMIETVGSHRFRLFESGSLDGYSVGRIAPIEDVAPEAESELEQASMGIMDTWTTRLSASRSNSDDSGEAMSSDVQMSADGSGSIPSSGSTTSTTSTFKSLLSIEEARDAYHCFQAALGIDSLMRQTGSQPSGVAVSSLIQRSTVELTGICNTFLETLRSGSAPWLITRLNDTYGPLPDASDVAAYGYWMAMVIPIDEHEKAKLLPIRSARLRLCIVVYWIEQLRQTWWFNHGCSVQ
jgi:Lon protease-like protein